MRKQKMDRYVFLVSLIAGILFMNFGKSTLLMKTGILKESFLQELLLQKTDMSTLFLLVFRKRFVAGIILLGTVGTGLGMLFTLLYVFWLGFSGGVLVTAGILRFGLKGGAVAIACMFPHTIFYWLYVSGIFRLCVAKTKAPVQRLEQMLPCFYLIILILLGCWTESYLSPILLKKVIMLCIPYL